MQRSGNSHFINCNHSIRGSASFGQPHSRISSSYYTLAYSKQIYYINSRCLASKLRPGISIPVEPSAANPNLTQIFPKALSIIMLFLTLAASILLSSAAVAAPTSANGVVARQTFPNVPVTFNGAAGASYTIVVVANDVPVLTQNSLSITSISMEGRADFVCFANGSDGSVTELVANEVRHNPLIYFFLFSSLAKWRSIYFLRLTNIMLLIAKRTSWPAADPSLRYMLGPTRFSLIEFSSHFSFC